MYFRSVISEKGISYIAIQKDKTSCISDGEIHEDTNIDYSADPCIPEYNDEDFTRVYKKPQDILKWLNNIFDYSEKNGILLLLQIMMTYCADLFQSLPIIWIKTRNVRTVSNVECIGHSLCFNPYYYQTKQDGYQSIDFHIQPSSLIISTRHLRNNVRLLEPIERWRTKDNNFYFMPRIIVSYDNPDSMMIPGTLETIINNVKKYQISEKSAVNIHIAIMLWISKNSVELIKEIKNLQNLNIHPMLIPIQSIGNILFSEENDVYNSLMEELNESLSTNEILLNPEDETLSLMQTFLKEKSTIDRYSDKCIPITKFIEYLEKHTCSTWYNRNTLSRFLNERHLVKEKRRKWIKDRQETCILIDQNRLKQILS